jgi:hypothetical protein
VARACIALGGGGHRLAAAFSAMEEPAATMVRLREVMAASADRSGRGAAPIGDEVMK